MSGSPTGESAERPEEERSSRARAFWTSLSTPQRWGGALVLALLPVLLAFALPKWFGGDDVTVVGPTGSVPANDRVDACKERAEGAGDAADTAVAVCRRPFWTETPTLYGVSFERNADPAFSGLSSEIAGEVVAFSVEHLVREAAEYAGQPVFVVGRVARNDLLGGEQGIDREVRLVGRDTSYGLVVSVNSDLGEDLQEGQIVADNVYVAARGVARFTGSSRTVDAAYALGFLPEEAEYLEGSAAIQREARKLERR